jgi:hypothetical protein
MPALTAAPAVLVSRYQLQISGASYRRRIVDTALRGTSEVALCVQLYTLEYPVPVHTVSEDSSGAAPL